MIPQNLTATAFLTIRDESASGFGIEASRSNRLVPLSLAARLGLGARGSEAEEGPFFGKPWIVKGSATWHASK